MAGDSEAVDGALVDLSARPTTQMLLAVHHDRYTQLLRAFLAWKRRAQAQRVRRKRIATACRVGSVFCQRIYWTRWREFAAERQQQRQNDEIKDLEQEEKEEEEEKLRSMEEAANNVGITQVTDTIVSKSDEEGDSSDQSAAALMTKRHYIKRWKRRVEQEKKNAAISTNVVVRIRSLHAIRRWRGFVRTKKDCDVLLQRAYFFLYYWLLKRSLSQLGRHALTKRRKRQLTVIIAKVSRKRLLLKSMQRWRLRLRLHQTLALWSGYVRRRRHQTLLYRSSVDVLTRKSHQRLLQHAFDIWEKKYARIQAQRMLVRVVDRHLYQKACERAWRIWKANVHQLAQLDTFHRRYQELRLRTIWNAWRARTREKEHREKQRRRAVRHYYLALLRKGFNGFRAWRMQGQLRLNRVETMLDAADGRMIASAFSRWDHFTSCRKRQALTRDRAVLHWQSQLLKRVWTKGFLCYFVKAQTKKKMLIAANEHFYNRTLRRCFCLWKDMWQADRDHDEALSNVLQDYMVRKARATEAGVFENWSEFTRAKAAARVVNAQVRGYAQRRMLQTCFSQWITSVSVLRWQQITLARAEQHHKAVLFRKCLNRWRYNLLARQRYRKKTRNALIHWKLTLERTVFDGWKQYLEMKKCKQQRIHAAFEFRHEQFVRDGLRHWMTAAMHLQEQREQRVTVAQASNTTTVWRRVAAIARHWRYLVIRRRAIKDQGKVSENPRNAQRRFQDAHWTFERSLAAHAQGMPTTMPPRGDEGNLRHANVLSESSNWTNGRSPLSGFVLLPRNRPQPRRPVDVMLFAEAKPGLSRGKENTKAHEVLRCGFNFPAEHFVPFSSPTENQVDPSRSPRKLPSTAITVGGHSKVCGLLPTSVVPAREGSDLLLPSSTLGQLDALERQLSALSQRKREWAAFQRQLDAFRGEVNKDPRLQSKLRSMEEQHATRTKQWLRTKERIHSLAAEIQFLRNALQR